MDHKFYDSPFKREETTTRRIFDDTVALGADREPCIVCGHPTGDCAPEFQTPIKIAGFATTESLKDVQTFYVEQDIYVDKQITPFTKTKVLLHRAGKSIPYREAEKLGLLGDKGVDTDCEKENES